MGSDALTRCNQKDPQCEEPPAYRFTWAGQDEAAPQQGDRKETCTVCHGYGHTTVAVHDRDGYPVPEMRKCDDCDGTGEAPAPQAAPETPGTTKLGGQDEQDADAGRPEDEAERRDEPSDASERAGAAVLGLLPADGNHTDGAARGDALALSILRRGTTGGTVTAPEPAPTTDAPILPVCLDCSFASGGHVHVNREGGSQAVRYPTPAEWNAALRSRPLPPDVEAAKKRLWHTLTPPRTITPDGFLFVLAADVETILRALDTAPSVSPEVEAAAEELQRIDNLLARRITLDGLTRVQKIALALRVCEETDPKGAIAARYIAARAAKGGGER